MIRSLSLSERRGGAFLAAGLALLGLVMAAAARSGPMAVHGGMALALGLWLTLLLAGALGEPEAPADLAALLQSAVADYEDAGQPVRWLGGPPAIVRTRPRALRRIVGNLIDNALKFGGAAEVLLTVQDGRPAIVVQDRGPGIPAQELDKVRQPFYRIEASRNAATGGTGLGLAIVLQLAPHCHAELRLAPREGGGLTAGVVFDTAATSAIKK